MHAHPADHQLVHAHRHETGEILRAAETLCQQRSARLTAQRKGVLEMLADSPKPLGAYDLIEETRKRTGRAPAPIAIYRALEFLQEHGLIHRLETLNAFIACPHHHKEAEPVVFLICETCRDVTEAVAEPLNRALVSVAGAHDFMATRQVVELAGRCTTCRKLDQTGAA